MLISCVQCLQIILLDISINFFNLSKLTESIISSDKCNGCNGLSLSEKGILIKKTCDIISVPVCVLKSAAETLLSSSCINEEKKDIAIEIRNLSHDIKFFLMDSSHILNSTASGSGVICQCNKHKNIDTLTEIIVSIIDIK